MAGSQTHEEQKTNAKENVTQGFRFYKLKDRNKGSMRTKLKTVVSSWCGEAVDCGNVMFLHLLPKYPTAVGGIPLQQQGPCLIHSVPAAPSPEPKTQQESMHESKSVPCGDSAGQLLRTQRSV